MVAVISRFTNLSLGCDHPYPSIDSGNVPSTTVMGDSIVPAHCGDLDDTARHLEHFIGGFSVSYGDYAVN